RPMFDLLQCEDIGMALTESMAMAPAARVRGAYLAHPQSPYFNAGKVGDDQVDALAQRSAVARAERGRRPAPTPRGCGSAAGPHPPAASTSVLDPLSRVTRIAGIQTSSTSRQCAVVGEIPLRSYSGVGRDGFNFVDQIVGGLAIR